MAIVCLRPPWPCAYLGGERLATLTSRLRHNYDGSECLRLTLVKVENAVACVNGSREALVALSTFIALAGFPSALSGIARRAEKSLVGSDFFAESPLHTRARSLYLLMLVLPNTRPSRVPRQKREGRLSRGTGWERSAVTAIAY